MLNRKTIINSIKKLKLPQDKYCIMTGAALVLHRVKEEAADIDIGCTWELFEELQHRRYTRQDKDTGPRIVIDDEIEIFPDWMPEQIVLIEDIPIADIQCIRKFKQQKARNKDLKDIELIDAFLSKKNNKL